MLQGHYQHLSELFSNSSFPPGGGAVVDQPFVHPPWTLYEASATTKKRKKLKLIHWWCCLSKHQNRNRLTDVKLWSNKQKGFGHSQSSMIHVFPSITHIISTWFLQFEGLLGSLNLHLGFLTSWIPVTHWRTQSFQNHSELPESLNLPQGPLDCP